MAETERTILHKPGAGRFVSMPDLWKLFVNNFNEESGHDIPLETYRTDHLKHRLLKHFGDRLVFFRSSNRKLVMTESVTKCVLLEHAAETSHGKKKDVDDDMEELNLW